MNTAVKVTGGRPVAVVGTGLVGSGWAVVFARAGLQVRLFDVNSDTAAVAMDTCARQLAGLERHGLLAEAARNIIKRVTCTTTLHEAVDGTAYVQESILERTPLKRALIEALDAFDDQNFVVGSSTSGIPASQFAMGLSITPRVLIAHPVNPPSLVPLVELVPSPATSVETVVFATSLMHAVGKNVVHVRKEVAGFVLNRLQAALLREAWALVKDGVANCEDVDKAVRDGLGWRWSFMGPFETIDLNAPGGVADYAKRLDPLYHSISESRSKDGPWDEALIREVENQRRSLLPLENLDARRAWRDERLMQFAASRDRRSQPDRAVDSQNQVDQR